MLQHQATLADTEDVQSPQPDGLQTLRTYPLRPHQLFTVDTSQI